MLIQKLVGKNFSNYNSFEYDFQKGITLINGGNLSGKSSILDLIRFSIYGSCIKAKKIEYFKKRGSTGSLDTYICFKYNNSTWEIRRSYLKKSTASITVDGDLKADGSEDTSIYIKENLISEDLLCNSNLVQQKDTTSFLSARPTDRFNICKKIFNLDGIKRTVEEIKLAIDAEKHKLEVKKIEYENLNNSILILDKELSIVNEKILGESILSLSEKVKEIQTQKDGVTKDKIETQLKLDSIQKDNEKIKKDNQEHHNLIGERDKLSLHISILKRKKETLLIEIKDKSQKKKELEDSKNKKDTDCRELRLERLPVFDESLIDKLNSSLVPIYSQSTSIKKEINLAESGKCPTCGKETDHLDVIGLKESLEQNIKKEKDIQEQISELRRQKQEIDKRKSEQEQIRLKKQELLSSIEVATNSIKNLEDINQKNKEMLDSIEADLTNNCNTGVTIEEKINSCVLKPIISVDEYLALIKVLSEKLSNLEEEINSINQSLDTYKIQLNRYKEKKVDLNKLKDKVLTVEQELQGLDKGVLVFEEVRNIYEKKLPLFMVLNKLKLIQTEANKFLHSVFDKYTISFEQEKDALQIITTDNVTNISSDFNNLSGFESGICGLAVRMGFAYYNNIMTKNYVNWVALDEVDSDFEESNSELLFNTIKKMGSLFSQILMITHKPYIKEFISPDYSIEVKNNKLNSYIEEN